MRPLRVVLLCVAVALASIASTAWLCLVFLAPSKTAAHVEGAQRVPFSDLIALVDAGRVQEIRVDGAVYVFSVNDPDGKPTWRETVGPKADLAEAVRLLHPADPSKIPPKITFASR